LSSGLFQNDAAPRLDRRRQKPTVPHVIIVGHGAVGRCALTLLCEKFDVPPANITVLDAKTPDPSLAPYKNDGLTYLRGRFHPDNLDARLANVARRGDILINVSTGIDSLELADWCQRRGVLYVDTTIETWDDGGDEPLGVAHTEYVAHQRVRRHAAAYWRADGPTAIVTHGANPGLVNHFVKAALIEVADAMDLEFDAPTDADGWAKLARATGTKVIHISELDSQTSSWPRLPREMANTWSVEGLIKESLMRSEIGWGTHEKRLPEGARVHRSGPRNAIYFDKSGAEICLRSWVPSVGPMVGLAMPHSECVTLSDYLTIRQGRRVLYRPTVSFVYRPSETALDGLREVLANGGQRPPRARIMDGDIADGRDELGVLLLGHGKNGWWYGSRLDIHEARKLAPGHNATVVQVAAGVLAAALWALRHPSEGFCEPENLPHDEILALAGPYLGKLVSRPVDWKPAPANAQDPGWQWVDFLAPPTVFSATPALS